jgi:hypothetical protein
MNRSANSSTTHSSRAEANRRAKRESQFMSSQPDACGRRGRPRHFSRNIRIS